MTRLLGSFNRLVNLPSHKEDRMLAHTGVTAKQPKALLGYNLGVHLNTWGLDRPLPTNAEKFVNGKANIRMAGSALYIHSPGSSATISSNLNGPIIDGAEIRNPSLHLQ